MRHRTSTRSELANPAAWQLYCKCYDRGLHQRHASMLHRRYGNGIAIRRREPTDSDRSLF